MSMIRRPTILAAVALVAAAAGAPAAFAATEPLDGPEQRYDDPLDDNGFVAVGWNLQPDHSKACSGDLVVYLKTFGGQYEDANEDGAGDGDQYYLCTGSGDDSGLWKESNHVKHLQTRNTGTADTHCEGSPGPCTPNGAGPGLP